jgi:hypothetical protein
MARTFRTHRRRITYHNRLPFILRSEQLVGWLGDGWLQVLENPDRTLLEKSRNSRTCFSTGAVVRAHGTTGRKGKAILSEGRTAEILDFVGVLSGASCRD